MFLYTCRECGESVEACELDAHTLSCSQMDPQENTSCSHLAIGCNFTVSALLLHLLVTTRQNVISPSTWTSHIQWECWNQTWALKNNPFSGRARGESRRFRQQPRGTRPLSCVSLGACDHWLYFGWKSSALQQRFWTDTNAATQCME